jgi:CxxC motif-containing protein
MEDKVMITCVSCPMGCDLNIEVIDEEIKKVEGNRCPRGVEYAKAEYFNPTRVLPTTAKVKGGILPLVPVKTAKPIPKGLLEKAMREIAKVELEAPVKLGDIVIKNVLDTGVDVVATRDLAKK